MKRLLISAALVLAATASTAVVDAAATHQEAPVNWHAQQAPDRVGPVDGASASLVRNTNGVRYRVDTEGLTPGHAYTLWLVVVNEPGECAVSPCTGPDILLNPDTESQVTYAAGHVAGASGHTTFAGHASAGPLDGWLDDRELADPQSAEIHLVVNDHGPKLPAFMPDMISTYRGGCSDASPFPGIFPPSALADGEPGPNECRLFQAAIFLP